MVRTATSGRVVAVYGAPRSGKSTVCEILKEASKEAVVVARSVDQTAAAASSGVAELVLLDYIGSPEEVQALSAEVRTPCALVEVRRHQDLAWRRTVAAAIEERARMYGMKISTAPNESDIQPAVVQLARVAKLLK